LALSRQATANATARGRPPRVVGFADLAVDAILGEITPTEKRADAVGWREFDLGADVPVTHARVVVDRPALHGGDDGESVRVENAAFNRRRDFVPAVTREEVGLRRLPPAALRVYLD